MAPSSYLPIILSHLSISLDTVVLVVETQPLSKLLISRTVKYTSYSFGLNEIQFRCLY
jgi:hypothetical protein